MRLIDLIAFIRTSSQMYYHQTLTDYQRLELIKLAFPRSDLIKWFDELVSFPVPPERYMLLLLMSAAAVLIPPHMMRVQFGSQSDLDLFRGLSRRHNGDKNKEIIIGSSTTSGVADELAAVGSDRIGLVQGIAEEAGPGTIGVVSALTLPAAYARRICIVSDSLYSTYRKLNEAGKGIIALQGHSIYEGILQYWPDRTSTIIFRSFIDPAEAVR